MPGESARINGRKGGRPKGGKNDALAVIVRQRLAEAGLAVAMAQIQKALGCQQVYKQGAFGKWVRVTNEDEIFKYLSGGCTDKNYLLVAAVDADNAACEAVLNRAFGQPVKQVAVTVDDRREQFKELTDHDLHVRAAELGGELNGQVH